MKKHFSIILLISFILLSFSTCQIEGFNEGNKTIYLIWCNLVSDETHNGFGDKLRGAIFLNHYCKENGIRFIVDGTDDICGKFLKNIRSNSYHYIKDKQIVPLTTDQNKNPDDFYKITDQNEIFIYTNISPDKELIQDDKDFAKYISEPQDFLKTMLNEKISQLPQDYGIQHFRFSDDVLANDIQPADSIFIEYFNILSANYQPTDILLSNSNTFIPVKI